MRPKSLFIPFLALALAGATVLAWQQWQELTLLRAAAMDPADRGALEDQLADLRRQNRDLQSKIAAFSAGRSDGPAADEAPEKAALADKAKLLQKLTALGEDASDEAPSRREESLELLAAMADLPEFQRMLALQQRGRIEFQYADLFKRLNLPPEQLSRLQTLLGDRQGALTDAMLAAQSQGLTGREARALASQVARTTQKEINASIESLLGPERYNQLQSYERTAPQRAAVGQLAERLSYTAAPLTPHQQNQLVHALTPGNVKPAGKRAQAAAGGPGAAPQTKFKPSQPETVVPLPGSVAGLGLGAGSSVAISSDAIARAQAFLDPGQLAALQRMQQEQQAQQTLGNLLRNGTVTPPVKAPNKAKPEKPAKPNKRG